MNILMLIILIVTVLVLLFSFLRNQKKKKVAVSPIPAQYKMILAEQVPFYQQLDEYKQKEFENREHFLAHVKITGVKTGVEDVDKILIC